MTSAVISAHVCFSLAGPQRNFATSPGFTFVIVRVLTVWITSRLSAGSAGSVMDNVERLARLARACGLDGVVCSAQEAKVVRKATGGDFVLVTPGIRTSSDGADDQARVVTPVDAVRNGANYLVIGRSITAAADPAAKLAEIRDLLEGAIA